LARFARSTLKIVATLLILTVAVLAALIIWDFYVASPRTRDGSVRVQVANVAPQVSGRSRKSGSSTTSSSTGATFST
jgi:multidrug resistance efflux pump